MTQKPKKGSSPKAPKVPATSIAKKKSEAEVISGQLDRSVILKAKFDQSGLDAKAQSRAVAALDRLLGGMIGWPAAFFEGKRERAEAKNKIRLEQLLAENMRDKIVHRMLADENRKQENLEGVWAEAEKLLVSPKIAEETAQYNAETEELAEDWMNIFTAYAEKASSERLKQLWGSILSGEIRKPSSFSPTALRIISELDAEIASSFQEIVEYRFDGSRFGITGDILLKPNQLSGAVLDKWTILEEVGLLQEVNGNLSFTMSLTESQKENTIPCGNFMLLISKKERDVKITMSVVKISRAGSQISKILPRDDRKALKYIASLIKEEIKIELAEIVSVSGNKYRYTTLETIKP